MATSDRPQSSFVTGDNEMLRQRSATLPFFDEVHAARKQADSYLPNATDLPVSPTNETIMSNKIDLPEDALDDWKASLKNLEIKGLLSEDLSYDQRKAMLAVR